MQRKNRVSALFGLGKHRAEHPRSRRPEPHDLDCPSKNGTMGAVLSQSTMSEMPDAAWMDWIAGGLAIVVFVGGLVMMFTGILTSKNR
ncbi:hypothetical protein PCC6311_2272 [Synechococcus elongatus PCC 6311]|uniref:Uncharacterized protein n=1 Tax=Synechococcus elongatus (strain ATCC 33912 / PCC 7942 / FACHB-805) TaxID=1140 RepID=Q31L50_SYNE7|nr:hypothetical protein Synpcc7942_2189 [Synechococcus elongatus PCC 7942 = FACHB-805]UOW72016.1 hypothetical protein PCC7943_2274 [Synechococcus elongatus PCC 7943]UOW74735.1 hypothetical protein PCC6311_2272 [Synechococcus elongatus PCC 6311]UOW77456.1 hypothetical protein PCC6301pg_2274 [Synechococcus elongatus PCC 6301]